jgi:chromosome segregation ATPase
MTQLPTPREAQQLWRLRKLRVQRARDACAAAQAAIAPARSAVQDRQRKIAQLRRDIDALGQAVVNRLAPQLPRWSGMVIAQRDKLADRLERDEYALIGEEHRLEEAQDAAQQANAELTRALAREDAVHGLVDQARRALRLARERRAEVELEDQGPPRAPARAP